METDNDNLNDFPQLRAAGKKNPFSTPESYFDELPSVVATRIHSNKHHRINWIPRLAVIAGVLAGAVILVNWYITREAVPTTQTAYEITSEHITESGYLFEMDEHLLVEALSIESIENEFITNESEELQDFLIDNTTDINLIINEL
jgi:hypothetical protein